MDNEEKFRENLRDLVDSREFPFQEEDWDKAAAYISRKRLGVRMVWVGVAVLITVLVLTVASLLQHPRLSSSVRAEHSTGSLATKQSQAKQETTSASVQSNTKKAGISNSVKQTPQLAADPGRATVSLKKKNPSHAEEDKQGHDYMAPHSQPAPETTGGQEVHNADGHAQGASTQDITSANENANNAEDNTAATGEDADAANDENTSAKENPALVKNNVKAPAQVVSEQKGKEEEKNEAAGAAADSSSVTQEPKTDTAAVVSALVPDSSASANTAATRTVQVRSFIPFISIEAGPSYRTGWKENGQKEGAGVNACAGVFYNNPVTENILFSFGAQYQRISGLSAYSHESRTTVMSFGEESDVLSITPRKMHYIAAPLRLTYLKNRNGFGISYTIAYLLEVESDATEYHTKAGLKTNEKVYQTRGYTDGFRLFDNQLSLYYRRYLVAGISVQAEVFSGLNDIKSNNFFGNYGSQRQSGLRVLLQYNMGSGKK